MILALFVCTETSESEEICGVLNQINTDSFLAYCRGIQLACITVRCYTGTDMTGGHVLQEQCAQKHMLVYVGLQSDKVTHANKLCGIHHKHRLYYNSS